MDFLSDEKLEAKYNFKTSYLNNVELIVCPKRLRCTLRQVGVAVITRASHLYDPGSTPELRTRDEIYFKSQSDSWFFIRLLRFSSLSKISSQPITSGGSAVLRDYAWIVFSGRAPSRKHSSFGPTLRRKGDQQVKPGSPRNTKATLGHRSFPVAAPKITKVPYNVIFVRSLALFLLKLNLNACF